MLTKTSFSLSLAMVLAVVTAASAATRPVRHPHTVQHTHTVQHQVMTKNAGRNAFAAVRGGAAVGDSAIAIQDRFYRESN
jgi:hypothetical protein